MNGGESSREPVVRWRRRAPPSIVCADRPYDYDYEQEQEQEEII